MRQQSSNPHSPSVPPGQRQGDPVFQATPPIHQGYPSPVGGGGTWDLSQTAEPPPPNYRQDVFTRASSTFVEAHIAKRKRLDRLIAKDPHSSFIPVLAQELKAEEAFYDAAEGRIRRLERDLMVKAFALHRIEDMANAFIRSKGLQLEWLPFCLNSLRERREHAA